MSKLNYIKARKILNPISSSYTSVRTKQGFTVKPFFKENMSSKARSLTIKQLSNLANGIKLVDTRNSHMPNTIRFYFNIGTKGPKGRKLNNTK